MDYKLIIFGNNIYREIELSEDMKDGILIGTTPVCEVRFNREYFLMILNCPLRRRKHGH